MHTIRLRTLAQFLATKAEPRHFDMSAFFRDSDNNTECDPGDITDAAINECGSVACAIGHAPLLFRPLPGELWISYSDRVFNLATMSDEWKWLFAAEWSNTDNTLEGAAKRIHYLLDHGLPDNWEAQLDGEEPLCYV